MDRLFVDDFSCTIPTAGDEIRIRVGSGAHQVSLRRLGYEPFNVELQKLGWGESSEVVPAWELSAEGESRERYTQLSAEVETAKNQPSFEQHKTVLRMEQFRKEVSSFDDPNWEASLEAQANSLRSPLDRPVMERKANSVPVVPLLLSSKEHSEDWQHVSFDGTAHYLAAATSDGSIEVFRCFDWKTVWTSPGKAEPLSQLFFSGAVNRAIGVSEDGIKIFGVQQGQVIELQGAAPAAITEDGRYLVYCRPTSQDRSELNIYDLFRDKNAKRATSPFKFSYLLPQPESGLIVAGGETGMLTALSWKTGKDRFRKQSKRPSFAADAAAVRQIVPAAKQDEYLVLSDDGVKSWTLGSGSTREYNKLPEDVDRLFWLNSEVYRQDESSLTSVQDSSRVTDLPIAPGARVHCIATAQNHFVACLESGRLLLGRLEANSDRKESEEPPGR
ncbi:MAG: hypothetical protein AAF394_18645 [Planctomycetota bacterium]